MISLRDTLQPLPSMSHDTLVYDFLGQPTSTLNDVKPIVPSCDHIQGNFISHVEEKIIEHMFHLSSLFKDENIAFVANH